MDWRPDGNLLAFGGDDHHARVFDLRQGRIVKKFDKIHAGKKERAKFVSALAVLARFSLLCKMECGWSTARDIGWR